MDKTGVNEGYTLTIYQNFLRRNDLSLDEKSMFLILITYANNKERKAFPKIETLKRITGKKTHNSVIKILRSLETKGMLEIKKSERKKNGVYANNVYFLKFLPTLSYHSDKVTSNYINNNNNNAVDINLSFNGKWNE